MGNRVGEGRREERRAHGKRRDEEVEAKKTMRRMRGCRIGEKKRKEEDIRRQAEKKQGEEQKKGEGRINKRGKVILRVYLCVCVWREGGGGHTSPIPLNDSSHGAPPICAAVRARSLWPLCIASNFPSATTMRCGSPASAGASATSSGGGGGGGCGQ